MVHVTNLTRLEKIQLHCQERKKREKIVLPIEDKVAIFKMIDKGISRQIIAEKFGIGKSTVGDIKKEQEADTKVWECNRRNSDD